MTHRIAERATIALVQQLNDVGDALAERVDGAGADQLFAGLIDVVDATADIGGDDAFAERVERFHAVGRPPRAGVVAGMERGPISTSVSNNAGPP